MFFHPFSDFSVTTRMVQLGITIGVRLPFQREGTDVKTDRNKQQIGKWSVVGGRTVTLHPPSSPVLPVRAPGHLQLDLLAVFDATFEGLIDQQSVTEDSTRPSFFEHAS